MTQTVTTRCPTRPAHRLCSGTFRGRSTGALGLVFALVILTACEETAANRRERIGDATRSGCQFMRAWYLAPDGNFERQDEVEGDLELALDDIDDSGGRRHQAIAAWIEDATHDPSPEEVDEGLSADEGTQRSRAREHARLRDNAAEACDSLVDGSELVDFFENDWPALQ